jgi:hypothetical protein
VHKGIELRGRYLKVGIKTWLNVTLAFSKEGNIVVISEIKLGILPHDILLECISFEIALPCRLI